jgi:hypothetical protein
MKNLLLTTLISASALLVSFNTGGYETAMKNTLDELKNIQNLSDLVAIANKFNRIGAAEKDQWLPYYYSAYCYIIMTTQESDVTKWDDYLNTADNNIGKAEKLNPDMVEILALKGFSSMMRINVDPAVRGQEYSMKSVGYLQQANQLDDQNPRVILMMAQMQYGTAQFFGSDTAPICNEFKKAVELFEQQSNDPDSILPSWGKPQAQSMVKNCEG